MHSHGGFTLMEMAIVLVVIGLLLGGVLKGQELIESGRIRNAVATLNGISAAVNAYRDRYRGLPGDDAGAAGRGWLGAAAGNGDGQVGPAAANPFAGDADGETLAFWSHLRFAGLIRGDAEAAGVAARPRQENPFDGDMGVSWGHLQSPAGAVLPLSVCLGNVPGKAAIGIDGQMDDGVPATGSVRASVQATPQAAPQAQAETRPYSENLRYVVCRAL